MIFIVHQTVKSFYKETVISISQNLFEKIPDFTNKWNFKPLSGFWNRSRPSFEYDLLIYLREESIQEPCFSCGRSDQPERFHTHPGIRYSVFGIRYLVFPKGISYFVFVFRFFVLCLWNSVFGIRYLVFGIWYSVSGISYLMEKTWMPLSYS